MHACQVVRDCHLAIMHAYQVATMHGTRASEGATIVVVPITSVRSYVGFTRHTLLEPLSPGVFENNGSDRRHVSHCHTGDIHFNVRNVSHEGGRLLIKMRAQSSSSNVRTVAL
mgnify:CR=1 FL=1